MSATSRSRKSRISRGTGSKKTSRGKRRLGSTSSRLGRVPRASLYVGTKHGKATLLAKPTRKGFDTFHGPFADPAEARYFRDRFNAEDYAPLVYDARGVARLERNGRTYEYHGQQRDEENAAAEAHARAALGGEPDVVEGEDGNRYKYLYGIFIDLDDGGEYFVTQGDKVLGKAWSLGDAERIAAARGDLRERRAPEFFEEGDADYYEYYGGRTARNGRRRRTSRNIGARGTYPAPLPERRRSTKRFYAEKAQQELLDRTRKSLRIAALRARVAKLPWGEEKARLLWLLDDPRDSYLQEIETALKRNGRRRRTSRNSRRRSYR